MPKLKILLDECLNIHLANEIPGYYVKTVVQMGWAGLTNGKLLSNAQTHFDVFITNDQNLSFQQNLGKFEIAVIVLCPTKNQLENLKSLIPQLMKTFENPAKGKVKYIR